MRDFDELAKRNRATVSYLRSLGGGCARMAKNLTALIDVTESMVKELESAVEGKDNGEYVPPSPTEAAPSSDTRVDNGVDAESEARLLHELQRGITQGLKQDEFVNVDVNGQMWQVLAALGNIGEGRFKYRRRGGDDANIVDVWQLEDDPGENEAMWLFRITVHDEQDNDEMQDPDEVAKGTPV